MLAQCLALTHLDLSDNQIGPAGAESFAGVLARCSALAHLNQYSNGIRHAGAESFAGVLGQCSALTRLYVGDNSCNSVIGTAGRERLRASWSSLWRGDDSSLSFCRFKYPRYSGRGGA